MNLFFHNNLSLLRSEFEYGRYHLDQRFSVSTVGTTQILKVKGLWLDESPEASTCRIYSPEIEYSEDIQIQCLLKGLRCGGVKPEKEFNGFLVRWRC